MSWKGVKATSENKLKKGIAFFPLRQAWQVWRYCNSIQLGRVASNRPAEGGLHCRPLPRPSAPPRQPPRPPPSWARAASPSPSPRESPSWAGQWGANTNFFVVDSEQALVVDLLRFTSILSNFFSWGRVRRTKIIESEFHKKMTSLTRLCFSVYKYCNLCVCRPSCPLSRGFQTSSSWKAFAEVEARAPSVSQNYLKQTWLN